MSDADGLGKENTPKDTISKNNVGHSSNSSSSAWLESSLDSDSLDVFSSIGRSNNSDSRELKGIYPGPDPDAAPGILDESSYYDLFSFKIDENGKASDFHHVVDMPSARTPECDATCYWHKGSSILADIE
ncbi:hypothetical protein KI387_030804, partial [Taxus chinensis]